MIRYHVSDQAIQERLLIGPPKKDRKQSIKNKTMGPSVFTYIFWVCPFVAL